MSIAGDRQDKRSKDTWEHMISPGPEWHHWEAGAHPSGCLPPISYMAGGLQNVAIRKVVCEMLESEEAAFHGHANCLRVCLER